MIGILDLNIGNPKSIKNLLDSLFYDSVLINSVLDFECYQFNTIIVPGVGSYDQLVVKIESFREIIFDFLQRPDRKVIGICLGAQLLCTSSPEGILPGLSYFNIALKPFPDSLIKPKMCWDKLVWSDQGMSSIYKSYFSHSYYMPISEDTICTSTYGNIIYSAVLYKNNNWAIQFHPEKSHEFGAVFFRKMLDAI